VFNASDRGVRLGDDIRKILHGGQRMAKVGYTAVKNIAERFKPLSRVQQRYRRQTTDRQTTDDRRIYDSKHPNVM